MKIEEQVCGLELAKQLKELGVNQRCLFYWAREEMSDRTDKWNVISGELQERIATPGMIRDSVAAFSAAELGEMLPITIHGNFDHLICDKAIQHWFVYYARDRVREPHPSPVMPLQSADTEADARAKMLIYLIENELIPVS